MAIDIRICLVASEGIQASKRRSASLTLRLVVKISSLRPTSPNEGKEVGAALSVKDAEWKGLPWREVGFVSLLLKRQVRKLIILIFHNVMV